MGAGAAQHSSVDYPAEWIVRNVQHGKKAKPASLYNSHSGIVAGASLKTFHMQEGIRINSVKPGYIETPLVKVEESPPPLPLAQNVPTQCPQS